MLEKDFQRKVLKILNLPQNTVGGVWVTVPRTQFGNSGVSDLVFATAAIELKAPGSRYGTTVTQQAFIDRVNANGGLATTVKSFDDLTRFINDFRSVHKT